MLRRSAIAGGALLWVTPVVQTLGTQNAYAWHHQGSKPPHGGGGACTCSETITDVIPVACWPDKAGKHRLAPSGKTVQLQVVTVSGCGGSCTAENERTTWTQVSAVGCELLPGDGSGGLCEVHVTSHPAHIVLKVDTSIDCVGVRGHTKSCSGSKRVRICFSDVVDHACDRCGRFPPHPNTTHGTEPCH